MVSATWSDIDPEQFLHEDGTPCAFDWPDSECLPPNKRSEFICPDIRTEYLPSLSIISPDLDSWPGFSDTSPLLQSSEISEQSSADDLYRLLSPLAQGYANWLSETELAATALDDWGRAVSNRHFEACRASLHRLESGLALIREDDNVRAAFQFANKAIHLANEWKKPGFNFSWRPFQLAFLIMNLDGLADRAHPDREVCDLLWYHSASLIGGIPAFWLHDEF